MASLAKRWRMLNVTVVYLILYVIVANLEPEMSEYMASIGIIIGVVILARIHGRYKKAVRENDSLTRKEYKKVLIWIMFYIISVTAIYFMNAGV